MPSVQFCSIDMFDKETLTSSILISSLWLILLLWLILILSVLIPLIRKLRHRQVKELAKDHGARKWWHQESDLLSSWLPDVLIPAQQIQVRSMYFFEGDL